MLVGQTLRRESVGRAEAATRARILVVDDDDGARGALEKLLSAEGFATSTAPDGEAALAEATSALPDVVLTDLQMPRLRGIELCQRLHEIDSDLPVIVMTAFSDMQSVVESLRAGAEDYLIKPLQYEAVLWCVERAIARRIAKREQEQLRDEYLALISHDLRNPLSSILMLVSTLKRFLEQKGLAEDVGLAERAERNVKRMNAMLEELTEATSLESHGVALSRVACDLRELVAGVIDGMDDARARRITIETEDASPYVALVDASRLERVVENLLTNALKYSAGDAPVNARLARQGSNVELDVVDRGIGIAPESVEMLFDRYYRTTAGKARASGLGLGLYIARLIVEAHGGRIDVSSEVGKGSTFRLILPSHDTSA